MDPAVLQPLIPIAAIIMFGLVKISRHWRSDGHPQTGALEARLTAVEQELATLQQDLSEAQERLDFAERLLAQSREEKRIGPAE
jgi:hypothetical protein